MIGSYENMAQIYKALSDVNRLKIIKILAQGEICACEILDNLEITQATLSHHMKILCSTELVNFNKVGKWTHYRLNEKRSEEVLGVTSELLKCIDNYDESNNCECTNAHIKKIGN